MIIVAVVAVVAWYFLIKKGMLKSKVCKCSGSPVSSADPVAGGLPEETEEIVVDGTASYSGATFNRG